MHCIMQSRNFALNPREGLKISAFKDAHTEGAAQDRELVRLGDYLVRISSTPDFQTLDHRASATCRFQRFGTKGSPEMEEKQLNSSTTPHSPDAGHPSIITIVNAFCFCIVLQPVYDQASQTPERVTGDHVRHRSGSQNLKPSSNGRIIASNGLILTTHSCL
jgi:hypothetical protein